MRTAVLLNFLLVLTKIDAKYGIRAVGPSLFARSSQAQWRDGQAIEPQHLPLRRISGNPLKQHWLQEAGNSLNELDPSAPNSTRLTYVHTSQYIGALSFGNQEFQVIIDTGSSDTWVVHKDFTCVDYDFKPISRTHCRFGPTFNGTFQYGAIPGVNFSISYADGESVRGLLGYEDVTIAGITVKKQQVGLASQVYGGGDGVTSGLLGLAYPLMTSAHNGTGNTHIVPGSSDQRSYDPVFTSMAKQGLVTPPLFSMSMDRNNSGWLTLGGVPPVAHGKFSNTPIRKADLVNISSMKTEYSFYTIVADDYILGSHNASNITIPNTRWSDLFNGSSSANQFPIVVDSGSTLISLPTQHAEAYTKQFSPSAVYNPFTAEYWAPCTAKVPKFGVTIGGQTFVLSEEDLLQREVRLDWNGDGVMFCRVGVSDGYRGPFILGDVFLNSVVAVYDVGIGEMHFAPRL